MNKTTMDIIATALVVGIIGPLFWLGVGIFDNWVQRNVYPKIKLLARKVARRKSSCPPGYLRGPPGVREQDIQR